MTRNNSNPENPSEFKELLKDPSAAKAVEMLLDRMQAEYFLSIPIPNEAHLASCKRTADRNTYYPSSAGRIFAHGENYVRKFYVKVTSGEYQVNFYSSPPNNGTVPIETHNLYPGSDINLSPNWREYLYATVDATITPGVIYIHMEWCR